jgi:hypothetical protein
MKNLTSKLEMINKRRNQLENEISNETRLINIIHLNYKLSDIIKEFNVLESKILDKQKSYFSRITT